MQNLFITLESIVQLVTEIYTLTENQESVILHGVHHEMLSELARHKQERILELAKLERQFEILYGQKKEQITNKEDIKRLQTLVAKILETKEKITKCEEKNRQLFSGNVLSKPETITIRKPNSYVIDQYRKHNRL